LHATIEQFCAKEESLQSELGSDLVSQLSVEEQATVDRLNDVIEHITQELKDIIRKRVEVRDKASFSAVFHRSFVVGRHEDQTGTSNRQ
jgi:predicted Mrr-cat superfamily restriction endonuclease